MLEPLNMERARQQIRLCHTHRQELAQKMDVAQIVPFVVYFEDVYSCPQAGRALIERLLAFLDIRPEDHADYEMRVSDALFVNADLKFPRSAEVKFPTTAVSAISRVQ